MIKMMIPTIPTPQELLDKGFSRGKKQADLIRSQKMPKHLKGKRIEERRVVTSCQVIKDKLKSIIDKVINKDKIGVCIDTCSTLGICAERNAIFNMITNGENEIDKVLAIMPDGSNGAPCGACRELMVQLMPGRYQDIEILMDYKTGRTVTLGELTPEWWID